MRNVWKGLVVGGLTGVAAGVVLDSVSRASKKAAEIGSTLRDRAPDAERWVHSLSDKAGDWVHDKDVPEHLRDAAQRVKDSDAAQRVAEAGRDVVSATKEAAASHRD
jgi:ABC-type transporter Mla subunit MlaD